MNIKKIAKNIVFKVRFITSRFRRLPDFIIIGVQKGGTSSLFYYLKQHPEIFTPMYKEIHFFDLYFNKGLNWYRAFFPISSKKVAGEASPYYIFHPHVAKRIKKYSPHTKFLVVLREPVSRAYSHYKMEKLKGNDSISSFEEAFDTEFERTKVELKKIHDDENYYSHAHHRFTYFQRGLYYDQISKWFQYFDAKQFIFIKSENLSERPKDELKKVYNFLNVRIDYPTSLEKRNQGIGSDKDIMLDKYYEFFREDKEKLKKLLGDDFSWE